MKKKLHCALALACIYGAGCKGKPAAAPADETPKPVVQVTLVKPHRQALSQTISVTGVVSPLANHESKVAPIAPGRIKAIFVNIGNRVSKGQMLAQLDPGTVSGQVQQAQATVRSDEEAVKQARINYSSQLATQRSSVAQAEQNVRAQQVALSKLISGARPQEIAQAEASLTSAEAALTNAEQNLSRSQTLAAQGLLARKDLEAAQSARTTAAAQVRTAQEALSLVRAGNRPQDIQAGRIALQQAEEQLKAAQASALQNRSKQQDVRIAEQTLANARGALNAIRAQLSGLAIRAPISGTVTVRPLNVGEYIDTTGSIATIADLTSVRLLLQVPAAQINMVRAGQSVEFTPEGASSSLRHATVSVIGKMVDAATNTITVEALTDNRDLKLRDDTFVKGTIILEMHPDALVVPAGALVKKDEKTVVFVVGSDNIAHSKEVVVGFQQNGMSEVSGIQATDMVVTTGAYELDDGTQVKTGS